MRSLHVILQAQLDECNPVNRRTVMDRYDDLKREADRLACTGEYKKAAALYANLGFKTLAARYEAQAKIKKS